MPKNPFLPSVAPKPWLGSESFRSMTPPIVRFLMPNKVFGVKKVFWGPPKSAKLIFLKNPNSVICPNMEGGQESDPSHPDSVRPLGPRLDYSGLSYNNARIK